MLIDYREALVNQDWRESQKTFRMQLKQAAVEQVQPGLIISIVRAAIKTIACAAIKIIVTVIIRVYFDH